MTNYCMISLTTHKISRMNCRTTSLKIYKKFFKEILLASFSGKDAKNSSDYRASLLIVCGWLMKKQPDHFVTKILLTHTQIQEIFTKLTNIGAQHQYLACIVCVSNTPCSLKSTYKEN